MYKSVILFVLILSYTLVTCDSSTEPDPSGQPGEELRSITLNIDTQTTHQTIDGFGFFGARSVWWDGNENNLYNDEWAEKIIKDLGITIWRNEYYPPETLNSSQDADWEKQRPVVEGIARAAENAGVDLKMIFTVWSPPEDMKVAISDEEPWTDRERLVGTPHSEGTKDGGALDPTMYEEFGHWLANGIQLYEDLGIDVYAISPQNEPFFSQFYNSCFYTPVWYAEMLEASIPIVMDRYPDVKIFGAEGMLSMEVQPWFHHAGLMEPQHEKARDQLDIWAVHGYVDGVNPTETSEAAEYWQFHFEEYGIPTEKPVWMTETSGYHDHWLTQGEQAGAMDLGLAIHTALHYGNVSAWVWWQGSDAGTINEFNLMQGEETSKRYYVSKQFYRYIRPGAVRLELNYDDSKGVFATAYRHDEMDTFTLVAINTNSEAVSLQLEGDPLPQEYQSIITTASGNAADGGIIAADEIELPANSIVTLVHGTVYE